MKKTTVVFCSVVMIAALLIGYDHSQAASGDQPVLKIGTVSVRKVLRDSPRNAKYRSQVLSEQSTVAGELDQLSKEEKALEAGLMALKPGTADYVAHLEELLRKQADIQLKEQLANQRRLAKDHRWTEDLYKEILKVIVEVAKEKGLDMVMESDEVEFPLPSSEELMMALRTNKLLYARGSIDITKDVLEKMQ